MTDPATHRPAGPRPASPAPPAPAQPPPPPPSPRPAVRLLLPALAAALALPLLTAAHHARPVPYGGRLTTLPARGSGQEPALPLRADGRTAEPAIRTGGRPTGEPALRTSGHTVEAYDPATGRNRWTYARTGHRPLAAQPAPGHAFMRLAAQPCAEPAAPTEQVVPVDALGRVVPGRTPLGNRPGPRGPGPEKRLRTPVRLGRMAPLLAH